MGIPRTVAAIEEARVHLHGAVLDMFTFAFSFQLEPGNSQGKHCLRDLPVRQTSMKLWQSERKTLHKSQGFRVVSSMGSGGPELSASSSQALPSQAESSSSSRSQGLIFQTLCHVFSVHCHIKMQTRGAWAQSKQGLGQ